MIQIKRCINLKKLIDAFDIKENQITALSDDFETFKNKALLNELRNKIIQNVIDKKMSGKGRVDEYIKTEIDKTVKNYDLTSSEMSYLYDLIDFVCKLLVGQISKPI